MTDWAKVRKRTAKGLRRALHVVAPVAKVAKEATQVLSTIAKPTPMGLINAAGSALSTLSELVEAPEETPGYMLPTYVPAAITVPALVAAGFVPVQQHKSTPSAAQAAMVGTPTGSQDFTYPGSEMRVRVGATGQLWWWDNQDDHNLLRPVAAALDRVLPQALQLTPPPTDNERSVVREMVLTNLTPPQTAAITARTIALLGDHRAILLEGRPGVGKTTLAQAIARDAGLGRVLVLDNTWLTRGRLLSDMWSMLSLGVIIIDDIDKVSVGLGAFEILRSSCRLLILTANNGTYDSVIDAALARPARIDEVFTITAQAPFQRPPFDQLPPAMWDRVSQWPQAYLNELELRLRHTPRDLRLKDLVVRLKKRTVSAAGLLGDEDHDDPDNWWDTWDSP